MEKNMTSPRHGAPPWRRIGQLATVVAIATVVGVLAPMGAAFAGSGPDPALPLIGTGQANVTGGLYTIGTASTNTIPVSLTTFSGIGLLPTAVWSDATGTGYGWIGSVQVSDFTYTGLWTTAGAQLNDKTSSAYTGTQDGVVYTVTAAALTDGAGSFSWACPECGAGNLSGVGNATSGPNVLLSSTGSVSQGVSINFGTLTTESSTVYQLQAGTQASDALSLIPSATLSLEGAGVTVADGSLSADPVLSTDAPLFPTMATIPVGGSLTAVAQDYGTAVPFVTAVANTGMGSYTVNPGVTFNADVNSWAALYTANVQYSMVTGP
jgi:hypothetical protein